jgi:hypothetical protein
VRSPVRKIRTPGSVRGLPGNWQSCRNGTFFENIREMRGRKPVDVTTISVYNKNMRYEWVEQKRRANIKKHGIDFIDIPELFDGEIIILPDERFNYGETRFIAIGILRNQVMVVA